MSWDIDANAWAVEMFGECQLGDKRRTDRLVNIAQRVIDDPAGSFPRQMESTAELKAADRFFNSHEATFQVIASPHWSRTRQDAQGRTLVICDTTDINFGSRRQIEEVGPTGNGSGQGFLFHNAMMVDADRWLFYVS